VTGATPEENVRAVELIKDRGEAAVASLVDEHYGAMRRLARLVGRGGVDPGDAVGRAWAVALARPGEQPAETSVRGWLLRLVLDELAVPPPPAEAPQLAPPSDFEDPDGRWAGWWKDELPATPDPERELLERAVASIPAGLAAMLVLRDIEGVGADETAVLTGHEPDRQLVLLHYGRVAVRSALRAAREAGP
jgi:DNA-directed RNA polymerase specialized sigma24 family protein